MTNYVVLYKDLLSMFVVFVVDVTVPGGDVVVVLCQQRPQAPQLKLISRKKSVHPTYGHSDDCEVISEKEKKKKNHSNDGLSLKMLTKTLQTSMPPDGHQGEESSTGNEQSEKVTF